MENLKKQLLVAGTAEFILFAVFKLIIKVVIGGSVNTIFTYLYLVASIGIILFALVQVIPTFIAKVKGSYLEIFNLNSIANSLVLAIVLFITSAI